MSCAWSRQWPTGWSAHSKLAGYLQMAKNRMLETAFGREGISTEFGMEKHPEG